MNIKFLPKAKKAGEPGMGADLYIALLEDFDQLKSPSSLETFEGETATIIDTHTFKPWSGPVPPGGPTKVVGFLRIPLTATKSGNYSTKQEGEFPAQMTVSEFQGRAVGLDASQIEWLKKIKGQHVIVIVKEADCKGGKMYQIGCDCKPVESLNFEFSSENNELKLSGKAECDLAEYKGTLTLHS